MLMPYLLFLPLFALVSPEGPPRADVDRTVPNSAFGLGERLVFDVEFLGITAGKATLEIPEILDLGRAKAYRLVSESRTNSFFNNFYSVHNRYESYIDVARLCSWRYVEDQQEKGTFRNRISEYDQERHVATVTRFPAQKRGHHKN